MPWPFGKKVSCEEFGESLGDLVLDLATAATNESMVLPVLVGRDRERVFAGYLALGDHVMGSVVESMRGGENYKSAIDRGMGHRLNPIMENTFQVSGLDLLDKIGVLSTRARVESIVAQARGGDVKAVWAKYTIGLMLDDPVEDETLTNIIDKYVRAVHQAGTDAARKVRLSNPGSLLEQSGLIMRDPPPRR
jgi:hypothetical protein